MKLFLGLILVALSYSLKAQADSMQVSMQLSVKDNKMVKVYVARVFCSAQDSVQKFVMGVSETGSEMDYFQELTWVKYNPALLLTRLEDGYELRLYSFDFTQVRSKVHLKLIRANGTSSLHKELVF